MKKVLFLMILLFLIGLGAAGVKAQVRIGGNTPPSAAAVLDLNASDAANTGKGGLVLPRVDLQSNTMQLTSGVANQTGTMVYNVTTTLGRIGVYYWNGNSWVLASLPSTTAADAGQTLVSNGTTLVLGQPFSVMNLGGSAATVGGATTTWVRLNGFVLTTPAINSPTIFNFTVTGLLANDICVIDNGIPYAWVVSGPNGLYIVAPAPAVQTNNAIYCYRPSN